MYQLNKISLKSSCYTVTSRTAKPIPEIISALIHADY